MAFLWRTLDALVAMLLLWAATVNLNDPDPARWVATYSAAGLLSLTHAIYPSRQNNMLGLALASLCLVWSASLSPAVLKLESASELNTPNCHEFPHIEESRESLGLLIAGLWSLGIVWRSDGIPNILDSLIHYNKKSNLQ